MKLSVNIREEIASQETARNDTKRGDFFKGASSR